MITNKMKECFKITLGLFLTKQDEEFICLSLPKDHVAYEKCRSYIENAIKEFDTTETTLEGWLGSKIGILNPSRKQMRQFRIDWLTRLSQGIESDNVLH